MPVTHTSFEGDSVTAASAARVRVLLPLPLAGAYDYAVPSGMNVAAGDFVSVPLGARRVAGVVWGHATDEVAAAKVKPIAATLAAPPMSDELRQLIDWVASYTLSPPGAVLRMAMSVPEALEAARNLVGYGISDTGRATLADESAKLSAPRRRVLDRSIAGARHRRRSRAPRRVQRRRGEGLGACGPARAGGTPAPRAA